ncbi:MAG TPA: winged helix-turn-helix domain-containing protein [Candidatus Nitrosotalea sp.]|nr:winged helix-turn-helix domain-containing protein [Candidatus Nitrosotalea sp.]
MDEAIPNMGNSITNSSVIDYPEEIEIFSLPDERLKLLMEELSNETSQSIIKCILEGNRTAGEIASMTNLSISLVAYHLERLLKTGIIKISNVEMNSKNRATKVYNSTKTTIVIKLQKDSNLSNKIKSLLALSASIATIGMIMMIVQFVGLQNQIQIVLTDPDKQSFSLIIKYIPIILSGIITTAATVIAVWLKKK